MFRFGLACAFVFGMSCVSVPAETTALLKIKTADAEYTGKVAALNRSVCWVVARNGELKKLTVSDIKSVEKIAAEFKPLSVTEMRATLRKALSSEMQIAGSSHYLVAAKAGFAKDYVQVFESVYRNVRSYFSRRGFKLAKLEYPLVAIVYPSRAEFNKRCRADGVPPLPTLRGYYLRTTNHVVLYDDRGSNIAAENHVCPNRVEKILKGDFAIGGKRNATDTMIHEGIHQAAFNLKLHTRVGPNPKWVVEGLATTFESAGIRLGAGSKRSSRVNRGRLLWFRDFQNNRRPKNYLARFVSSDVDFSKRPLDAYSQAWALTFFLIETRATDYSKYLKLIGKRDPLKPYSPADRLADFKSAFGKDVEWLEVQFLRFIKGLK